MPRLLLTDPVELNVHPGDLVSDDVHQHVGEVGDLAARRIAGEETAPDVGWRVLRIRAAVEAEGYVRRRVDVLDRILDLELVSVHGQLHARRLRARVPVAEHEAEGERVRLLRRQVRIAALYAEMLQVSVGEACEPVPGQALCETQGLDPRSVRAASAATTRSSKEGAAQRGSYGLCSRARPYGTSRRVRRRAARTSVRTAARSQAAGAGGGPRRRVRSNSPRGERIAAVGKVTAAAASVIDGAGLVICRGFVDPHSHADGTILEYPLAENLVMQGITTFVGGNCGSSLAPRDKDYYFGRAKEKVGFPVDWTTFGEYLASVEKTGISLNFAPLVGLGTVKTRVMGNDYRRAATLKEIEEMKVYIDEAMKDGAFGLSAGLDYLPDKFARFEELIEVAEAIQKHGGLYVPHTRYTNFEWPTQNPEDVCYGQYPGLPENVDIGEYQGVIEAIEVSKKSRVRLHIAHISNLYNIFQPHPDFLEEVGQHTGSSPHRQGAG